MMERIYRRGDVVRVTGGTFSGKRVRVVFDERSPEHYPRGPARFIAVQPLDDRRDGAVLLDPRDVEPADD